MTECKHCGREIIRFSSTNSWDIIGEDDQWVHIDFSKGDTKHSAQPDWKTKS